jgi:hypothetical protein
MRLKDQLINHLQEEIEFLRGELQNRRKIGELQESPQPIDYFRKRKPTLRELQKRADDYCAMVIKKESEQQ